MFSFKFPSPSTSQFHFVYYKIYNIILKWCQFSLKGVGNITCAHNFSLSSRKFLNVRSIFCLCFVKILLKINFGAILYVYKCIKLNTRSIYLKYLTWSIIRKYIVVSNDIKPSIYLLILPTHKKKLLIIYVMIKFMSSLDARICRYHLLHSNNYKIMRDMYTQAHHSPRN